MFRNSRIVIGLWPVRSLSVLVILGTLALSGVLYAEVLYDAEITRSSDTRSPFVAPSKGTRGGFSAGTKSETFIVARCCRAPEKP